MHDLSTLLSPTCHHIRRFCPEHLILLTDLQMHSSYFMSLDAMCYFYCDATTFRHLGLSVRFGVVCWQKDQQRYSMCKVNSDKTEKVELIKNNELCGLSLYQLSY